ncbi:MAG: FAD-binding oxidoreductase, partial [Treponema sp.]
MRSIKDILIGTMENGNEVLEEVRFARKSGKDILVQKDAVQSSLAKLHPGKLDLEVSDIYPSAEDAKVFRFVSRDGYLPPFEAGQYINIFMEIDGVCTSRPYSISSSPKQRSYYEITVAAVPNGFVSSHFLNEVKKGDRFIATSPSGRFHYNPVFHSKKSVFLAGGSGITPFMSMIREVLESGEEREIFLLYGNRTEKLSSYHAELTSFAENYPNFHYQLVISNDESYKGKKGFIDAKCIQDFVKKTDDATFYMCGPQVMSDFCTKALEELHVKPRNIRREMFGTRRDIQNEPFWPENLTGKETFKISVGGKTFDGLSGESLLTSLERAGIRVNVCCRSGECSLCRVKLESGKV